MLKIVVFGKNLVQKSDEETLTLLKTVKPNNILPQPKKKRSNKWQKTRPKLYKKTNKLDEEKNDIETNVIVIVIVNLPKSNILPKQYHNQKKELKFVNIF